MSWIEERNITQASYNRLINALDDKTFQIKFLLERVNQMLCAESEVVRIHVAKTLSEHQDIVDMLTKETKRDES